MSVTFTHGEHFGYLLQEYSGVQQGSPTAFAQACTPHPSVNPPITSQPQGQAGSVRSPAQPVAVQLQPAHPSPGSQHQNPIINPLVTGQVLQANTQHTPRVGISWHIALVFVRWFDVHFHADARRFLQISERWESTQQFFKSPKPQQLRHFLSCPELQARSPSVLWSSSPHRLQQVFPTCLNNPHPIAQLRVYLRILLFNNRRNSKG